MKLQKYVLMGLCIIIAGSLSFLKISFACYTSAGYEVDCCELGYLDVGNYCCATWEDCFRATSAQQENCEYNTYRRTHPCDANPDNCWLEEALNNDEQKIKTLRRFRDEVLRQTPIGQEYIRLYYEWSPFIVQAMEEDEAFKQEVKELIEQLLPVIEAIMQ